MRHFYALARNCQELVPRMIFEAAEGFLAYLTRQVKSRSLAALRQLRVNARDDSLAVAEGFPFDFAPFTDSVQGKQDRLSTAGRDVRFANGDKTAAPFVVPGT